MSGERYMWGREAGDELSPQWTEEDVERMTSRGMFHPLRPAVVINKIHLAPKMTLERRARLARQHYFKVRLRPSAELKRGEAREMLAHLLGTLDLDAKPYAVPGTCVEAYCDKLEIDPT